MWKKCVGVNAILLSLLFAGYVQSGYAVSYSVVKDQVTQENRLVIIQDGSSRGAKGPSWVTDMVRLETDKGSKIDKLVVIGENTINKEGFMTLRKSIIAGLGGDSSYQKPHPFAQLKSISIESSITLTTKEIVLWHGIAWDCRIKFKVDNEQLAREANVREKAAIMVAARAAVAKAREAAAKEAAEIMIGMRTPSPTSPSSGSDMDVEMGV